MNNMELQANPDLETLKLILIISGSIILIMLAIVGYFIDRQIEASKALSDAVSALKIVVNTLKTQCDIQNPVFERRLNEHSRVIDDHGDRLTIIETEIKIHNKKIKQ